MKVMLAELMAPQATATTVRLLPFLTHSHSTSARFMTVPDSPSISVHIKALAQS